VPVALGEIEGGREKDGFSTKGGTPAPPALTFVSALMGTPGTGNWEADGATVGLGALP
jgi:hypothetical protein